MDLSFYRKINNSQYLDKKESQLYSIKEALLSDFEHSPSSVQVKINDDYRTVIITESSKSKNKKLISKPNETFYAGDYVCWEDTEWLVVERDPRTDVYTKGLIQQCYSSLVWLDDKGIQQEAPFAYRLDFYRGSGIDDGKTLVLPTERRYIYAQSNEHTQKIKKDRRFIFDGRAWKVTALDNTFFGLMYFELKEDLLDSVIDNLELRIADYYNNLHQYEIRVLNGSNISLAVGTNIQLNVEALDNGEPIDLPIAFTSHDHSIATVSNDGLITAKAEGVTTVTVEIVDNPSVSALISIAVNNNSVSNDLILNISGNDECKVSQIQTYSVSIINNHDNQSFQVEWILLNEDEVSETDLATVSSVNNTQCSIKGNTQNKLGYVKLCAFLVNDPSIRHIKRIKIRSLF